MPLNFHIKILKNFLFSGYRMLKIPRTIWYQEVESTEVFWKTHFTCFVFFLILFFLYVALDSINAYKMHCGKGRHTSSLAEFNLVVQTWGFLKQFCIHTNWWIATFLVLSPSHLLHFPQNWFVKFNLDICTVEYQGKGDI